MSHPAAPPPNAAALSKDDLERLAAALEAARGKGLAFDRTIASFESDVRRLAGRHFGQLGLPPTAERVASYVAGAALEDLVLACACEAGDAGAWAAFDQCYRDRLVGYAVRRGISGADADAVVSDVIGDLCAPPTRGTTRSILGTYDGSGSLFGWLSIVVLRRIAGAARSRKPLSLDALADAGAADHATPRAGVAAPAEPDDHLHEAEVTMRFAEAFRAAWAGLSPQERLALVAKHRDGLTQRRAGEILGVGEARASRVVAAGVGKLMEALRAQGFPGDGEADPAVMRSLAAEIGRRLASFGPLDHPRGAGSAGRGPAEGGLGTQVPGRVRHS
jgi:RNA polymerase sigma factor (sigma-70 family)